MNEIEKILKDNMEDYESVKRQALKFIHENKKELSKNYAYAEVCGNPVDASHFFFLIDEKKPGSDLLLEMLDALSDGLNTSMTPELIDEKVASMSCKAAVKGNNRLSAREVDALIGELLLLDNPYHCPHGRPTIIAMSKRELEKKFKRIV